MSQEKDPNVIMLKNVRLSYPQLFVAKAIEAGKEPKYSASFLLNKKEHAALITQIEKVTARVALDKFKKNVKLNRVPLRDGNEKEDKDGYGDEVMFLNASELRRPVVVDYDKSPLTAEDPKPYAGCIVNASIRLFAFDHPQGGKGVSAALRVVQFVKDGESFGAGPIDIDADGFESLSTDANDY